MSESAGTEPRHMLLYFQPVYHMDYQAARAYRSQTRIQDPELGVLLPEQYMPISERSNQCVEVTLWTLEALGESYDVLRQRRVEVEWLSCYIPRRALEREGFAQEALGLLEARGMPPEALCLETAWDALAPPLTPAMEASFARLKGEGVRFLARDFGAPYTPVGALDELPADAVLLDAAVGSGLLAEGRRFALAESLMSLAREQGLEMVAGGVENRRMAEALYSNGCAYMTGTFAGRWMRERSIRA